MSSGGRVADDGWQRLDQRMLLIHPVRELVRYIPVLIGVVIVGSRSDNPLWSLLTVGVIVVVALMRWFTTTYRIEPDTVQLRRGLLGRRTLTVPRSRIRSVDVRADVLHRALGLVVLVIGTGQHADGEERFQLDGVAARQVPQLRALLLRTPAGGPDAGTVRPGAADTPTEPGTAAAADRGIAPGQRSGSTSESVSPMAVHDAGSEREARAAPEAPPRDLTETADAGIEIGHWQPRWVRYAPLSLTGLAIVGPVIGLAAKLGAADALMHSSTVHDVGRRSVVFLTVTVSVVVVTLLVISAVAACVHYLTTYFGLRVLDNGTTLHIRSGLLTTRQTTLDLSRLRGATVQEPLLLRLAGGAILQAIMTGDGARQKLLPQAPRAAVERTLAHLLAGRSRCAAPHGPDDHGPDDHGPDDLAAAATPASVPLEPHGPRARRRRYTRALSPVGLILAALVAFAGTGQHVPVWAWVVTALGALAAAALAHDRYRGLGHTVIPAEGGRPAWLITRSGSLDRERDCLEAPGVIGWTVRSTYFQRRAGLATVIAASAAGKKKYAVVDLPVELVPELIEQVSAGQLTARGTAVPDGDH